MSSGAFDPCLAGPRRSLANRSFIVPQSLLFRALVAVVLLSPLPFGSFPVWAWSVMAGCTGLLLIGWGLDVTVGRGPLVPVPWWVWWSMAPFVLAMLWAVFQVLPFSPVALHHPLWRSTAEALGTPYAGTISLDPAAGRESIVRIATYAGIFWLSLQLGRDPDRARAMLTAVAVGAAGYALYGLVVDLSGANTILWLDKTAYPDVVTATFVNRNSFATFAGLGLLCATAMIVVRLRRAGANTSGLRETIRRLIGEAYARSGLLLCGWLVLAVALVLTESRGGAAASVLALLVFFASLALRRGVSPRSLILPAVAVVLAATAVFDMSGGGLERRLWTSASDWQGRAEIHERTRVAIRDAPVLGTGLGTFAEVYRLYRSDLLGTGVKRAHNDYLEIALELGVPAAAGFVAGLFALALVCAGGVLARRRNPELAAAGVGACALVGAHALVDFSLQIPAVAATFALVLGAATAQSWRTGAAGS